MISKSSADLPARERAQRALVPVGDLANGGRPSGGDSVMPRGQQVRDREVAAEHVVDRHRTLTAVRRPAVDEHHGGAPPLSRASRDPASATGVISTP